eukprot:scaffold1772_cov80-Cylindrotheca_fusiformis.AAC.9
MPDLLFLGISDCEVAETREETIKVHDIMPLLYVLLSIAILSLQQSRLTESIHILGNKCHPVGAVDETGSSELRNKSVTHSLEPLYPNSEPYDPKPQGLTP